MIKRTMFRRVKNTKNEASLHLYNTLGKELQQFTLPPHVHTVRMYNCGPTVYGVQHIGNLSMYVFADILRKTLEYDGFKVKQVINITDVGHLASDADEGEDKMSRGLLREGMAVTIENMKSLADRYTNIFLDDLRTLNIDTDEIQFPRATETIPAQIAMIQTLEEKGYAYAAEDGVYFDTARFPAYGALGEIDVASLKEGARVAIHAAKHNPADFALWKFSNEMGWESPWGLGFPGWHIECSAMIRTSLGEQIDIHTGGIEHIPVHHNNEIAQSESATGRKPLSRFWLHRAHIQVDGGKLAKSEGNVVYLSDVIAREFHPASLRYLFLGAHYRTNANFSWEALAASQTALVKLFVLRLSVEEVGSPSAEWQKKFLERMNDDLDTPGALAVMWEMTKDASLSKPDLIASILDFDKILNLGLTNPDEQMRALAGREMKEEVTLESLDDSARSLIVEREQARKDSRWDRADELRKEIDLAGYTIEDGAALRIFKKN